MDRDQSADRLISRQIDRLFKFKDSFATKNRKLDYIFIKDIAQTLKIFQMTETEFILEKQIEIAICC